MASYKNARNTQDVKRELSDIMRTLKDPRVTGVLSIVKLELSSDYSYCTAHISSVEGLAAAERAVEGLTSAQGFIRREIGARLKLRRIPEFRFLADDGIAYSANLNEMLHRL